MNLHITDAKQLPIGKVVSVTMPDDGHFVIGSVLVQGDKRWRTTFPAAARTWRDGDVEKRYAATVGSVGLTVDGDGLPTLGACEVIEP